LGIVLHKEPKLKNSIMFCGWPGIGNIGITAIDTLRGLLGETRDSHEWHEDKR